MAVGSLSVRGSDVESLVFLLNERRVIENSIEEALLCWNERTSDSDYFVMRKKLASERIVSET